MEKCLHCGGPMKSVEGRRPKVYCSDACRLKAFQAKKKAKEVLDNKIGGEGNSTDNLDPVIQGTYMGVPIPEGMNLAQTAVWKMKVKEKAQKAIK